MKSEKEIYNYVKNIGKNVEFRVLILLVMIKLYHKL
jgi:hypothetical protein